MGPNDPDGHDDRFPPDWQVYRTTHPILSPIRCFLHGFDGAGIGHVEKDRLKKSPVFGQVSEPGEICGFQATDRMGGGQQIVSQLGGIDDGTRCPGETQALGPQVVTGGSSVGQGSGRGCAAGQPSWLRHTVYCKPISCLSPSAWTPDRPKTSSRASGPAPGTWPRSPLHRG